jgi:sulfate transport system permease protein
VSAGSPVLRPGRGGVAVRSVFIIAIALLVAVPLAAVVARGASAGFGGVWEAVSAPAAADAVLRTLWTAALVAALNAVMGTATAWLLVRHRFPGRETLDAIVDLPFAVPTLVAGLMLVILFGPQEPAGAALAGWGIPIAYASPGIVLALAFVTLPFVVRAVEPVLRELDPAEEEAAETLGAGRWTVFRRVTLPALVPAIAYGTVQSFARGLAEFGSIIVVSGNIPFRSLTAPVLVFGEVEAGRTAEASAISLVLLVLALALAVVAHGLRRRAGGTGG